MKTVRITLTIIDYEHVDVEDDATADQIEYAVRNAIAHRFDADDYQWEVQE